VDYFFIWLNPDGMHILLQVVLFIGYAILNTAAMAACKSGMARLASRDRSAAATRILLGAVSYAAAISILLLLLKDGEASIVFPLAIGCTVLATNAVGVRYYQESLDSQKLAGTVLIVTGIALTYMGRAPG
jgi:multidrug transporter EmrE-like cation transporter